MWGALRVCPQLLTLILDFCTFAWPLVAVVYIPIRGLELANLLRPFHLSNTLEGQVTQERKLEDGCHGHKSQEGPRGSVLNFSPHKCLLGSMSFDSPRDYEENLKVDAFFLSVLQLLFWIWKSRVHNSKELLPGTVWASQASHCSLPDYSWILSLCFWLCLSSASAAKESTEAKPSSSWSLLITWARDLVFSFGQPDLIQSCKPLDCFSLSPP